MKRVKTNFGKGIIVLAVGLILALPVRVYQYLNCIESTTGFYKSFSNPTVFGLYGFALLMIILLLAFSAKGGKKTLYNIPQGKNIPLAITSFIFSLSLVADAVYQVLYVRGMITGEVVVSKLVIGDNAGPTLKYFLLAQALFAMFSAVYILLIGLQYAGAGVSYSNKVFFSVFPVLWGVVRMMARFMQTISYRYVSELLFEMIMIIFSCLFFVAFIRFSAGLLSEKVQPKIFGCGMVCIFFAFLCSVPRYVVLVMGRSDVLYRQSSIYQFCDIAMAVFIAAAIFGIMGEMQYKEVEEYTGKEEK